METIVPENKDHWLKLRTEVITSTEVPALFGVSPYMTEFELWHNKRDKTITSIEENERMFWGNVLEDAIAQGACTKNSWEGKPFKVFMKNNSIGSSFDWRINVEGEPCLLEIKNVDGLVFRDNWITASGDVEPPLHIDLQVQHQLLVSGLSKCYIAALVGGNEIKIIERSLNEEIKEQILSKVENFWDSINKETPPSPDFEKDSKFIMSMNQDAHPGKVLVPGDENPLIDYAVEYKAMGEKIAEMTKIRDGLKARMITLIGDHEKVKHSMFSIDAGISKESQVSYTRKPYRKFTVRFKKVK